MGFFYSVARVYFLGLILAMVNCGLLASKAVDNKDGTVSIQNQSVIWAKCSQVDSSGKNAYNAATNDCSAGSPGLFKYCDVPYSSCDNGVNLNGTGNSGVYNTCKNLTLANRSWRVATSDEMLSLGSELGASVDSRHIFPDLRSGYWTSSAANTMEASTFSFECLCGASFIKTGDLRVVCVSDGP